MSMFEQLGLSIVVKNPVFAASTQVITDQLAAQISKADFTTQADGGYWSASADFTVEVDEIGDWILNGVGRDITFYNEGGDVIWNGLVNAVSVQIGNVSLKSSAFLEIANQVVVSYQEVTYNTNPPVGGSKVTIDAAENTESQTIYGIQPEVLNAGTGEESDAEQYRDRFISERAFPLTSTQLSLQGGKTPSVNLQCVGYSQLLNRPLFDGGTTTGRQNASDKVERVFNGDPNGIFTDLSGIEENTYQVPYAEEGDKRLFEVLRSITAVGDASLNRWITGVGADRKPYYKQAVQEIAYNFYIAEDEPRIETVGNEYVYPWNLQAGKWLFVVGLLEGVPDFDDWNRDPRKIFIEQVRFSSVWGLEINGAKVFKAAQVLAQMGLEGSF